MSCESRHRAIITDLLALAGLRDTVDADTVMDVGVAHRRRRGGLPTPAAVPLHADAQHALEITGHSDHTTPAWVAALIDRLHTAAEHGSRRALLTMRWLTGGWEEVTPLLTGDDRGWLLAATCCGIQVPPAWETWRMAARSLAADIGRCLARPVRDVIVMMEILDALRGIDAVPPDVAQTVPPLQVLRLLLNRSFASRTDLQQVLRAVLDGAPVVQQTMTLVNHLGRVSEAPPIWRLVGCAAHARGGSVEQIGIDAVLTTLIAQRMPPIVASINPSAMRDPAADTMKTVTNNLCYLARLDSRWIGDILAALISIWRMNGRYDAVERVIQSLQHVFSSNHRTPLALWLAVIMIVTGELRPPHGDTTVAHLGVCDTGLAAWAALAAGALYAAACQRERHVPTIVGIENLVRFQWGYRRFYPYPSPIPLLAVGRKQELLTALHRPHDIDSRFHMIVDCIDALDMLDAVGGDPREMLAVLADALPLFDDGNALTPWLTVRLAASRYGQSALSRLPLTNALPRMKKRGIPEVAHRIIPHLASPWWATTPLYPGQRWQRMFTQVAESGLADLLDRPPPLYPAVLPQAVVNYPTKELVARAVSTSQWATLRKAKRRACYDRVYQRAGLHDVVDILAHAATDEIVQDVGTTLLETGKLSDAADIHTLRWLIGSHPRESL